MAKNPRELLNDFMGGLQEVQKTNGEHVNAFMNFSGTVMKPEHVNLKTKELISLAIALYARCEYCIVAHTYNALKEGATREEILETAMVAVGFGGGPTFTYSMTLLKDSIDEFEKDFK